MQKPANCGATHRPIAPFGRGGEGQLLFLRPRARDRRAVSLRHSEAPEHYQSAIKFWWRILRPNIRKLPHCPPLPIKRKKRGTYAVKSPPQTPQKPSAVASDAELPLHIRRL